MKNIISDINLHLCKILIYFNDYKNSTCIKKTIF